MNPVIYVTADGIYSDIDIYACSIAYAELLRLEHKTAFAVVNTKFAQSVTASIKRLEVSYINQQEVTWTDADQIVILDRSDTEGILKNIPLEKISELYDHHFGYEAFWLSKLGANSHIEKVGACATLIWEQAKLRHLSTNLSQESLILLYTAIISNTLYFKASVTDARDITASTEILQHITLSKDFAEKYFEEVAAAIKSDPFTSVLQDIKVVAINDNNYAIGQLELWDASNVEEKLLASCHEELPGFESIPWFITIAAISKGETYLLTKSKKMKELLHTKLGVSWTDSDVVTLPKLYLRKELIKKLQDLY